MVYPESPFTDEFNIETLISLKTRNDNLVAQEAHNLPQLLQWLCETPKITSFRVNTLISDVETAKNYLQDELRTVATRQGKQFCLPKIFTHHLLPDVILIDSYSKDKLDLDKLEKEIIVDAYCGAAVLRGAHIFSPGVLAMQHETQLCDRVSVYVDLSKKCKKGFAKIYDCPKKLFIANGIVRKSRKDLFKEGEIFPGIAIEITDTISGIPAINESNLPTGIVLLQNIPSIVCGHVLNPKPGDIVLDMCAAPGNKTSHLSALMEFQGKLIALDKTEKKLMFLQKTIADFQLHNVDAFCFDATRSCDIHSSRISLEFIPPFSPESFDKILLDAPCSGLGNRPQLLNTMTEKMAKSYVNIQKKLFENAVHLLKTEGYLVYSTCSISLAENEGIVAWALNKFSCLQLVDQEPKFGGPDWPGTDLSKDQLDLLQRFGPGQEIDSIGFFIAKFKKNFKYICQCKDCCNKRDS